MKGGSELGSRMNHFYVQMDASLMRTLIIPKKFAKIIEGSSSGSVEIEGPSRISCHVKMIRSNGTSALRSGWKEFVATNKIDKYDTLVFTNNGNSSFKVFIFDPSGCEKVAPFFAKKMEGMFHKSADSFMRVGAVPQHEVKEEMVSLSSDSGTENSSEISSHTARVLKRTRTEESTESDEGRRRIVRKRKEQCHKKTSRLYMVPHMTYLTKAQEKIANRLARNIQKGSESFVKILAPCHTRDGYCALNLPRGFECKVLQSKEMKITLLTADSDKNSKGCTANYHKNKTMRCIGQGWSKFVRRNGLKEGDVCLFEVRKKQKQGRFVTMIVHFDHE